MQVHKLIIQILVVLAFAPAFAQEAQITFGSEPTFTSQALIEAPLTPYSVDDDTTTQVGEKKIEAFAYAVKHKCSDCIVESGISKDHLPIFNVESPRGFSFQITLDVKVIEIIPSAMTTEYYQKNIKEIQSLIFESAKDIGVFAHLGFGGGHVHVGLKSAFGDDPVLFRNFVVDFMVNHADLVKVFGSGPANSPTLFDLTVAQQEAFFKVLEDFDNEITSKWLPNSHPSKELGEQLIANFAEQIQKKVYFYNPKGWSPSEKYQAFNFTRIVKTAFDASQKTVELRFFRSPGSAQEQLDVFKLIEGRLKYLRRISSAGAPLIEVHRTDPQSQDLAERKSRLENFANESGVTIQSIYPALFDSALKAKIFSENLKKTFLEKNANPQAYGKILAISESLSPAARVKFEAATFAAAKKERKLIPIAKVLTDKEALLIKEATRQRAQALNAFMQDIAHERFEFLKAGHMQMSLLERFFNKYKLAKDYFSQLRIENSGFFYAPDIVRGGDGAFVVLEDNVGNVGGMGDSLEARRDIIQNLEGYENFDYSAGQSIAQMTGHLTKAKLKPGEVTVALVHSTTYNESAHWMKQMRDEGIIILNEAGKGAESEIFFKGLDVMLRFKDGSEKRIRNIVVRNVAQFETLFPNTWARYLKGRVNVIGGADFHMFGDKELSIYVEEMIRFYLKEEPLLKFAETQSFRIPSIAGKTILNEKLMHDVFAAPHEWVVKNTVGAQGHGVYIGAKISSTPNLRETIKAAPGEFVAQKVVAISDLDGYITDIRSYAVVLGAQTYVADINWGRALSTSGDGKLNTHQSALVIPIFKDSDHKAEAKLCRSLAF